MISFATLKEESLHHYNIKYKDYFLPGFNFSDLKACINIQATGFYDWPLVVVVPEYMTEGSLDVEFGKGDFDWEVI